MNAGNARKGFIASTEVSPLKAPALRAIIAPLVS